MFHFEIHNLKGTIKARDICTPNTSHLRKCICNLRFTQWNLWVLQLVGPFCHVMAKPGTWVEVLEQAKNIQEYHNGSMAISFVSKHKNKIRQLQMRQLQTTKDNGITTDCCNELMTAAHHFRAIGPINCTWCMHFQWCTLDSCNQLRANQIRIFDKKNFSDSYCSHLFRSFLSNKQTGILCKLWARTVHRPQGVCQTASASGLELHQVENVWKCFSS